MKYPPRKVFVLEDGVYEELTYAQFNQKKTCYAGRRFIPLHGMLMEVSESDYKAFYKDKRRQKYLDERSAKNGDFSYDMLTTDEFNGEDILVDMASDTAGDVEKKIMLDNLRLEFKRLSEDEQKILYLIYGQRLSERAVAERFHVSQNAIHRRKVQILAKLRKAKNLK
ncbi:sigma factor-like helix-turn-helix DNA-binding protein [Acutalibacter intestini]|uniref:sigma factor-like helix-turn-helix DNA-binding protein n=1 Tax=Acutalibacter intestini TaxID=3093659 RepID=UPI002AC96B3C|nr:sigma factor-like helix-turn-helix DNA-binding protein [Acutalibacter sp. M00204]